MTVAERISTVSASPGVVAAFQDGNIKSIGSLSLVTVVWFHVAGSIARRGGGTLVVINYQAEEETAYWGGGLPDVLVPAPSAPGYITARNNPFTAAQVKAFANAQWRAQGAAYTNAPDILAFDVDNLDGNSVKISGYFWMDGGSRSNRSYVIRLVDANGLTTPASNNVKFEQIT